MGAACGDHGGVGWHGYGRWGAASHHGAPARPRGEAWGWGGPGVPQGAPEDSPCASWRDSESSSLYANSRAISRSLLLSPVLLSAFGNSFCCLHLSDFDNSLGTIKHAL